MTKTNEYLSEESLENNQVSLKKLTILKKRLPSPIKRHTKIKERENFNNQNYKSIKE